MNAIVAEFSSVHKVYSAGWGRSGNPAVLGVSLVVRAGEVFGLLGPNRAGKTTLVKLLLGLARPTSGSVTRLGSPASQPATLSRVGFMHENQHFPRHLTARELLHFYGAMTLLAPAVVRKQAEDLLVRVGLADRPNEPIARFSKGMVQRLGLAQALMNDPDLLVLDEPTEGLDLIGRTTLREVIAERKSLGKTVLLVSHVLSEVEQTCDRIGVIVAGKLVKDSSVADLVRDPKTGERRSLESALRPIYEGGQP